MPRRDTKSLLTSDELLPQTSKLENTSTSKLNSSAPPDPRRSLPKRTWDLLRSSPKLAHTPSHSASQTLCAQFIQCFMSRCLKSQLQTPFRTEFNLLHLRSLSMENQNSKSLKSWTPRLTNVDTFASYCTWYIGLVMKVLMKKLLGSSLRNSEMHRKSLRTFIKHILISLDLTPHNPLTPFTPKLRRKYLLLKQKMIIYRGPGKET
jgi:hypothetical protein